jgi:hypothetical protein
MMTTVTTTSNTMMVSDLVAAGLDGWEFRLDGTKLDFVFGTGAGFVNGSGTTAIGSNESHYVGMSWDGSNVQMMLDGAGDGNPAAAGTIQASGANLTIGNRPGDTKSWHGTIENVMIWNVALTLDELISVCSGIIPRPASLKFWQPCWIDTMPELITQTAATETGSVTNVDSENIYFAAAPRRMQPAGFVPSGISALLKVIDNTLQLSEAVEDYLGLLKVVDNDVELSEAKDNFLGILEVVADTLQLRDGTTTNDFSPAGKLTETMSDGTVWTFVNPPFRKRTQWTDG